MIFPGGHNNYLPKNVEEIHYGYLNETVGFSGPGSGEAKWYQRAADGTEAWNDKLVFKSTAANGLIVGEEKLFYLSSTNLMLVNDNAIPMIIRIRIS